MRHLSKIGFKLLAFILVLIFIPLTLIYVVTQQGMQNTLEAKIKVITENATNAAYEELERFLGEVEDLTVEIAESDTANLFITGMGEFIKSDLEEIQSKYSWIKRFDLVAEDGTYLSYPESEETADLEWLKKSWYINTKEQDNFLWYPALNLSAQFRVAIPIRFTYSDDIVGVFSLLIDMEQFTKILQQYGIDDGSMLLINQTGAVLASDKASDVDNEMFDQYDFFTKAFESENMDFEVYKYAGERRLTFTRLISPLKSIILLQVPERVAYHEIYNLLNILRWVVVITLVVMFAVTLLITRYLITKKLNTVVDVAESIAEGNLRHSININSTDEIGNLAHAFNDMTSGLRDLIRDILENSKDVAISSEQIHKSAEMSAQISDQVAQSIQQVAAGADRQSEFIDGVNRKLADLSTSIDGLSNTSKDVQGIARNTQDKANLGAKSMDRVIEQMAVIKQSIDESTSIIGEMAKATDEISNFVNIIDSIANQTNLLALNAAIEAARAGEEGRGFAVVAGEIRSLAEEVSVSAGKIRQLVQVTQGYSHKASKAMDEGVKQIAYGQEVINESGAIFSEIIQSFESTIQVIQLVDQMTSDVAKSTGQIVEGAEQIAGIAEENAASAEEVSASTEEQAAAMEEITRLAESLSSLSRDLEQLVERFKI